MSAGTYQINIGETFYIGSSSNLRRRRFDHQWRLRSGNHPSKKLQAAYTKAGSFDWIPTSFIHKASNESDTEYRTRLRAAEQVKIDEAKNLPGIANTSFNSRGPETREDVVKRWQDPEFRAYMAEVQRNRLRNGISEETRAKMALAKTGANNPKSRSVTITKPDGSTESFPSTSAAAKFFSVSQQLMDQWMKGIVPWPGSGRSVRPQYAWIGAYSAKFDSV